MAVPAALQCNSVSVDAGKFDCILCVHIVRQLCAGQWGEAGWGQGSAGGHAGGEEGGRARQLPGPARERQGQDHGPGLHRLGAGQSGACKPAMPTSDTSELYTQMPFHKMYFPDSVLCVLFWTTIMRPLLQSVLERLICSQNMLSPQLNA